MPYENNTGNLMKHMIIQLNIVLYQYKIKRIETILTSHEESFPNLEGACMVVLPDMVAEGLQWVSGTYVGQRTKPGDNAHSWGYYPETDEFIDGCLRQFHPDNPKLSIIKRNSEEAKKLYSDWKICK